MEKEINHSKKPCESAITENTEKLRFSLKQTYYIIDNILKAHKEDNFNELVPSWHEALLDAMKNAKFGKALAYSYL